MAHNINTYIGRQAAWHNLGTVTGQYESWASIMLAGGFDFDVFKSQLHDGLGRLVPAWGTFRWDKADKAKGDSSAATFLGAVGEDYKVIHHSQGFEMVDALVASQNGAHYETAGVLGNGEVVWGLADLNQSVRVGADDKHEAYLLFSTSHDGSMSYNFRMVLTRVVCQNTLRAAMSEKTKASFTVRHTKNAQSRIDDAHAVLVNIGADITKVEDKLNFLAGRKMTRESMSTIFDRLFPKTAKEDTLVSSSRRDNILGDILKLYEINDGNAFPEQRGTSYNLLNAITEYTDHERSAKAGGRAESAIFGSGEVLKTKAFEVILETSKGLPEVARQQVYASTNAPVFGGLLGQVLDATLCP